MCTPNAAHWLQPRFQMPGFAASWKGNSEARHNATINEQEIAKMPETEGGVFVCCTTVGRPRHLVGPRDTAICVIGRRW